MQGAALALQCTDLLPVLLQLCLEGCVGAAHSITLTPHDLQLLSQIALRRVLQTCLLHKQGRSVR